MRFPKREIKNDWTRFYDFSFKKYSHLNPQHHPLYLWRKENRKNFFSRVNSQLYFPYKILLLLKSINWLLKRTFESSYNRNYPIITSDSERDGNIFRFYLSEMFKKGKTQVEREENPYMGGNRQKIVIGYIKLHPLRVARSKTLNNILIYITLVKNRDLAWCGVVML